MSEYNYPEESENSTPSRSFSESNYVDSPWEDELLTEPVRPPGPGVGGALLWVVGVFVVHLIGGLVAFLFVAGPDFMDAAMAGDEKGMNKAVEQTLSDHGITLVAGEMAVFVLVAVIASLLAMGKNKGRKLGSHAIRLNHLMLMLAAVVPLAVFSGALYQMASTVFDWLTEGSQLAKSIKDMDTNKVMRDLGKDASIWMLLPLIAVAPAISEELIFRGVIGRGLIARHGLVVGVLITTFLFAAVHVNPPHVIAVIPLGLFMHYLYITTRSFWAPVLFHFLNNGLSTIMLKLTSDIDVNVLQEQETVPVYGFLFACVPIALIAITLWKSRVKFETHSGDEWTPGYVSTERPPNDGSAIEATQPAPAGLMISSLVLGGLLIAGYVVAAQEIMEQAPQ